MEKLRKPFDYNDPEMIKKRLKFTQKARGESVLNKTQLLSSRIGNVRSFVSTKSTPGIFAKICKNINNMSSINNNNFNDDNVNTNNINIEEETQLYIEDEDNLLSDDIKNMVTQAISPSSLSYKMKQKSKYCKESLYTSIELFRIHTCSNKSFAKIRDLDGNLPLHQAVNRSDANLLVVCALLKMYPGAARIKDSEGYYPLFIACRQLKVSAAIIKTLINAFPEATTKKIGGNLALHVLALKGRVPSAEAVRILLNANYKAASTMNKHGNLPLHYMCAQESSSDCMALRTIMTAYEEGITKPNKVGMTPIDIARSRLEQQSKYLEFNEIELEERMRILLRSVPQKFLGKKELTLLKDLNYSSKRCLFMIAYLPYYDDSSGSGSDSEGVGLEKCDDIMDEDVNSNRNSKNGEDEEKEKNVCINKTSDNVDDKNNMLLNVFLSEVRQSEMGIFRTIASFL